MNQNRPYVIVITGGIATGKSQVTNYLRNKAFEVFDSDKIVHEGYEKGTKLYKLVVQKFSDKILDENGNIDREKLGSIVFKCSKKLKLLNDIVHKYVVDKLMEGVYYLKDKVVFLDIPLMCEEKSALVKMGLLYDEIWLVYVRKDIQVQRLTERAKKEGKDVVQTLNIIDKQMPIDDKIPLVDRIIDNSGTIEQLWEIVDNTIANINECNV